MPDYSQLDPSKRDLVGEVNKLGLTEEQEIELALKFSENPEYTLCMVQGHLDKTIEAVARRKLAVEGVLNLHTLIFVLLHLVMMNDSTIANSDVTLLLNLLRSWPIAMAKIEVYRRKRNLTALLS
ncbi:hypothetical protein JHK87_054718 [Glycine soja]|nr:hypothetical protein JHK87_054718 [Glycine soja]